MPREPKSELTESLYSILEAKGLLKTASEEVEKESKELQEYKNSVNARVDSLSLKDIENLYNLKPESIFPKEKSITEIAHPEPVVIGNAYDKLNSLMHNDEERANIMHNLSLKPVNGLLTNHKNASVELVMSLIRIASDMDNKDNEELRALADACLAQLKKKANPWTIGRVLLWAVPTVIGLISAYNHVAPANQGVSNNAGTVAAQLHDVIEDDAVVKNVYIASALSDMQSKIEELQSLSEKYDALDINNLEIADDPEKIIQKIKTDSSFQNKLAEDVKFMDDFDLKIKAFLKKVPAYKSALMKAEQIHSRNPDLLERAKSLLHVVKPSGFTDVAKALTTFEKSLLELESAFATQKQMIEDAKRDQQEKHEDAVAAGEIDGDLYNTAPKSQSHSVKPAVPAAHHEETDMLKDQREFIEMLKREQEASR